MDVEPLTSEALVRIRHWFRTESRAYPWTLTDDPYAIWISEVMLQQTVVTAAVAPFTAWMTRWPDLASLATASEEQVLRAWEGLGYASRARNLHRTARLLVERGQRFLPSAYEELRALPGVGEYTASALLSFAFHQPALTLDANLKRVFQRLDAAPTWTSALEARWRGLWSALVDGPSSRESNQAVMQLGQRVCRARPLCGQCPLAEGCRARLQGLTGVIPQPKQRLVVEKSTTVVFWFQPGADSWWLSHPVKGRFTNLWLVAPFEGTPPTDSVALAGLVHTYTKFRDRLTAYAAPWSGADDPPLPEAWVGRWVTPSQASQMGMVSVYRRLWEEALSPRLGFSD